MRKEFDVNGLSVLTFWYRNQLYAIESRSPAEGAYAEGFIKAKFTQVRASSIARLQRCAQGATHACSAEDCLQCRRRRWWQKGLTFAVVPQASREAAAARVVQCGPQGVAGHTSHANSEPAVRPFIATLVNSCLPPLPLPQDYAIECPSTGSLFSLRDGSIVSWYPGNPVLRALTPSNTCRRMEIYPVKITQDAVYVDTSAARLGARALAGRGGAGARARGVGLIRGRATARARAGGVARKLCAWVFRVACGRGCVTHPCRHPTPPPPACSRLAVFNATAPAPRRPPGTSLENNNVFSVQPTVYFEGQDPTVEAASLYSTGPSEKLNPATVTVGILAVGILGVAGTATALYFEVRRRLWVVAFVRGVECRGKGSVRAAGMGAAAVTAAGRPLMSGLRQLAGATTVESLQDARMPRRAHGARGLTHPAPPPPPTRFAEHPGSGGLLGGPGRLCGGAGLQLRQRHGQGGWLQPQVKPRRPRLESAFAPGHRSGRPAAAAAAPGAAILGRGPAAPPEPALCSFLCACLVPAPPARPAPARAPAGGARPDTRQPDRRPQQRGARRAPRRSEETPRAGAPRAAARQTQLHCERTLPVL